jgi:ribosomal protein L7Ae-like RNA K-turn-binding protein
MLSVSKIFVNLLEQLCIELEVSVKQLGSRAEIGTPFEKN